MNYTSKSISHRVNLFKLQTNVFIIYYSSHKDEHKLIHKPKTHEKFPNKFEDAILTRAKSKWRPTPGLESRPTSTIPVQVPAGGLYKKPDAFKDKPGFGGDDEDFGLEFNDEKETFVKKR